MLGRWRGRGHRRGLAARTRREGRVAVRPGERRPHRRAPAAPRYARRVRRRPGPPPRACESPLATVDRRLRRALARRIQSGRGSVFYRRDTLHSKHCALYTCTLHCTLHSCYTALYTCWPTTKHCSIPHERALRLNANVGPAFPCPCLPSGRASPLASDAWRARSDMSSLPTRATCTVTPPITRRTPTRRLRRPRAPPMHAHPTQTHPS